MAPPDCREMRHQVQFNGLNTAGKWEPLCDIYTLPDYQEGYIYQVRYTKVYLSDFEKRQIADHVGFEVEGLEILTKIKN